MTNVSDIEIAILGLLYEHRHYSYRLKEIMEKRRMHYWTGINYSSMGDSLKRLEKKNLIEIKEKDHSEEIYYISDKGKLFFEDKIKELLSKKDGSFNSIYLGIANMDFLSRDEVIQSLELYLKSINERIEHLDNSIRVQEENKVPYNFIAIFSHSIALLTAERDWIKEFIEKIKEMG